MKAVLHRAVIDEIRDELLTLFSSTDGPKEREASPGRLEFAYPDAAYRIFINVRDDGKLESEVVRIPCHSLAKDDYSLSDPTLFTSIAQGIRKQVQKDRLLVRVLIRVGRDLHHNFVHAMEALDDWNVSFQGPDLRGDRITVRAMLQPRELRFAFPDIRYYLVLTGGRHDKYYQAKLDCSRGNWRLSNPEAWNDESKWNAEDLPRVVKDALRHVESLVLDRTLPFESVFASKEARQAMLVATPLRLAENAAKTGETAWCRELTDDCLLSLSRGPETPRRVLRQLFFQLTRILLIDPRHQSKAYSDYKRLGLILARMRYVDETLPYNPVLAYDRYSSGKSNLDEKLSKQDRETYSWFLRKASLEQIADLMSLP